MMNRLLAVVLALVVLLSGCSGVVLNAEYSWLLDSTATLSAETARRAETGGLTHEQMIAALKAQAEVWQRFQDARDGRGQTEPPGGTK